LLCFGSFAFADILQSKHAWRGPHR
jgi:hypothetical protein